jgi:hypothetical protein
MQPQYLRRRSLNRQVRRAERSIHRARATIAGDRSALHRLCPLLAPSTLPVVVEQQLNLESE